MKNNETSEKLINLISYFLFNLKYVKTQKQFKLNCSKKGLCRTFSQKQLVETLFSFFCFQKTIGFQKHPIQDLRFAIHSPRQIHFQTNTRTSGIYSVIIMSPSIDDLIALVIMRQMRIISITPKTWTKNNKQDHNVKT